MIHYSGKETLIQSVSIQSDDTDVTTANEDEALHQQPNNTRAAVPGTFGTGSKQNPRDISLSSKARCRILNSRRKQSDNLHICSKSFNEKQKVISCFSLLVVDLIFITA